MKNKFIDNTSEYKCPICGKQLKEMKFSINCDCGFKLNREIASKKLSETNIKDLFNKGKTGIIKGLKKKDGNTFDCMLVIDKDKKGVSFSFNKSKLRSVIMKFIFSNGKSGIDRIEMSRTITGYDVCMEKDPENGEARIVTISGKDQNNKTIRFSFWCKDEKLAIDFREYVLWRCGDNLCNIFVYETKDGFKFLDNDFTVVI